MNLLPETKFLADGMLGRLARWLRALGYDTVFIPDTDDSELLRRARSLDRVLLTSDHALAARRGARTFLVESQDLNTQLRQIRQAFGPPPDDQFSRCVACNGKLVAVDKTALVGTLPAYILETQTDLRRCPDCGRIFWPGTHVERMKQIIANP